MNNKIYYKKIIIKTTTFLLLALSLLLFNTVNKKNEISLFAISNDPFSQAQWYLDNPGSYTNLSGVMMNEIKSTAGIDMDVADAWSEMKGSVKEKREVVVAIIDTGVDYLHPDLADHMWINEGEIPGDNIDNDNNGYVDDVYGWDYYNNDNTIGHYVYSKKFNKNIASPLDNDDHGTHIAGIIAAIANNNTGIAGIASNINIKIMSLKITGGPDGDGDLADAKKAIQYATMMGADICNLSWGTNIYSAELEEAMRESDMLFVAAAGNTGDNNDVIPVYPASFVLDNLISVTFIDADGEMTPYSNYGVNSVDIAAPGEDIYSTIVGGYGAMSGSSMAAPQVSAIAALLYASSDHLYAANVKNLIVNNFKELSGLTGYMAHAGIPSALKAVKSLAKLDKDKDAPIISFQTIYNKDKMTVPVSVVDVGASQVRVIKWIYGVKTVADFKRGVNGTTIIGGKVDLTKAGNYTFYVADYAGNESVQVYEVLGDTSPPKLNSSFRVASDYKTRTVTINVKDEESGLKRLKYMKGTKKAQDFLPSGAGTEIAVQNGKGTFKVKKDGIYTIFAVDNRGNISVKPIIIKTVKATQLSLSQTNINSKVGDTLVLRAITSPSGSTDAIIFTSSDDKIAEVSITGKVTLKAKGKVYITVKTASGLKAKCLIVVNAGKSST